MSNIRVRKRGKGKPSVSVHFTIPEPVLIVEDQYSLAIMLATKLEQAWDVKADIAKTYAEAQALLQKKSADYFLALCDINLPDAPDGQILDLVDREGIPIIAITGKFGEESKSAMANKGLVDYVIKASPNAYEYVVNLVGRFYKNRSIEALIVDDSISSRALLAQMLETQRLQVHTAANGNEALEVLAQNPGIRLLITDHDMPDMNGFDLVLHVRRKYKQAELVIIGVSAMSNREIGTLFIKNGANDFLFKPFSYEELLCRINQNLELLDHIDSFRYLAHHDFLTSLFNRRYFFMEGPAIYRDCREGRNFLTAAIMDIDNFKRINDMHGHEVGDIALKHVANLLKKYFQNHLLARIGGEEFAVLIKGISHEKGFELLEAYRADLENTACEYPGGSLKVTVSIGVSTDLEDDLDQMLTLADQRLYAAKQGGKNKIIGSIQV